MHKLKLAENILDLIGNTPMLKLKKISQGIPAEIWAKVEYANPSGSVKDRIAIAMLVEAERAGIIDTTTKIIEPTTGNTGIALAMVCAIKGYQMIAVMPEAASVERRKMMNLLGAKVEVVKCVDKNKGVTKEDIKNLMKRLEELRTQYTDSFVLNQFTNPANPNAHAQITAQEILEQTNGKINAFVAACGTGGTFSGVARALKQKNSAIRCVVVEPSGSPVLSGGKPGFHKIQGIGEGFIPEVMDVNLVDEIKQVDDDQAIMTTRRLWKEQGIMAGISSGANVYASLQVGKTLRPGNIIITILPDSGLRYFSTELFE